MLIDCITGLPRVQWTNSMYVVIDQFMHFPVISSEYGQHRRQSYLVERCLESLLVIKMLNYELDFLCRLFL
jgi:hypothetical protein